MCDVVRMATGNAPLERKAHRESNLDAGLDREAKTKAVLPEGIQTGKEEECPNHCDEPVPPPSNSPKIAVQSYHKELCKYTATG